MKKLVILAMLAATVTPLAGCVVVPDGPRLYAGAHWVRGYYGPYGGWHRGHWS